jgi:hypothetical protein
MAISKSIFKKAAFAATFAVALSVMSAAHASVVYVGSWSVDQGQNWYDPNPPAFTGQEAAAFLYGGSASDYIISTIDSLVANINNMTWISTWGGACGGSYPCGTQVAENFSVTTGGFYLTPGDTSALIHDWAINDATHDYRNFAFRVSAVPLPAGFPLLAAGVGLMGLVRKRKAKKVSV